MRISGDVEELEDPEPEVEPSHGSASSASDFEEGELPLEPPEALWEVRREWAEALEEAGPPLPAHEPRLRTVRQEDS